MIGTVWLGNWPLYRKDQMSALRHLCIPPSGLWPRHSTPIHYLPDCNGPHFLGRSPATASDSIVFQLCTDWVYLLPRSTSRIVLTISLFELPLSLPNMTHPFSPGSVSSHVHLSTTLTVSNSNSLLPTDSSSPWICNPFIPPSYIRWSKGLSTLVKSKNQ